MTSIMGTNTTARDILPQSFTITGQMVPSSIIASTLDNQQTSPLLRLPAELRNRIYMFVFRTLPILVCFTTSHASRPVDWCPSSTSMKRRYSHIHYSRLNLALIATCRQAYFESRLLPFILNTFQGFPEAILAAFPGRLYYAQLTSVTRIELMVATADIAEGESKHEGQRWGRIMEDTLDTVCGLPQLRMLRVTSDSGFASDALWKQFTDALAETIRRRRCANGLAD